MHRSASRLSSRQAESWGRNDKPQTRASECRPSTHTVVRACLPERGPLSLLCLELPESELLGHGSEWVSPDGADQRIGL
jgi:hypothetical protein